MSKTVVVLNKSGTGAKYSKPQREQKWHQRQSDKRLNLLRNVYGADHGSPQHPLLTHHELLEEVDCNVVVWREEDSNIASEKVIDLALTSVLRLKLLRRDMCNLCLIFSNLMHILVVLFH